MAILSNPESLQLFSSFLFSERPSSTPLLEYYLLLQKALAPIDYGNLVSHKLENLAQYDFTSQRVDDTVTIASSYACQM